MADQEHVERLKRSVAEWNEWRQEHPDVRPDLSGADLGEYNLGKANLSRAILSGADLTWASLDHADLSNAELSGTRFIRTSLTRANLTSAYLVGSYSSTGRYLIGASLIETNLTETNLTNVRLYCTTFVRVDLRLVKGLETAIHYGPSIVDINTVDLPLDEQTRLHFLRGVGWTSTQVEYLPSLLMPRPIEYSSMFISYASQDEAIARRLYNDLRKKDVPCWFAPHNLVPGDSFREEIDKAIHMQEKLLLILSKDSVESRWVKYEVNCALNREIEQERKILYPIRLDDTVLKSTTGWASHVRLTRHIGDFTNWREDAAYQEAFSRLLSDLKVTRPPTE